MSTDTKDDLESEFPVPKTPAKSQRTDTPGALDPIQAYFREIQQYPLLTHEEENRLALTLRQTGDIEIARKLVTGNLRLVVKIALEYRNLYTNLLDLIQEGNIGLMKAVSKFDPARGATLGYYASWWIRSYILKYLLDNFRLVKVGTTQAQKKLFYHLMREKQRLEAQGLPAGPKLLAERLDVREKDVIEMEQRLGSQGSELSLDQPLASDEGGRQATLSNLLPSEEKSIDTELADRQMLQILKGELPFFQSTLNDREKRILKERLLAEAPKTLQEIAEKYGLTRERVRQIESRIVGKLKSFLGPHLSANAARRAASGKKPAARGKKTIKRKTTSSRKKPRKKA